MEEIKSAGVFIVGSCMAVYAIVATLSPVVVFCAAVKYLFN